MSDSLQQHPLSLADVTSEDFALDPTLTGDATALFLSEHINNHHDNEASSSTVDASNNNNGQSADFLGDQQLEDGAGDNLTVEGLDDAAVRAIKASLSQAQARQESETSELEGEETVNPEDLRWGDKDKPIHNPPVHMAPYSKPDRNEETPHPEHMTFDNRSEFESWLQGESSWCHFVQRRTTTPHKRAAERAKAREKAHEKALMNMTPEEAASAPALKKRRRAVTSPVVEKVTYTCHHAGKYSSKHSDSLPANKLRLNTKTSVKCNCPARVVLTETGEGKCTAQYHWKHEGHEAYGDAELESGKLPKVIDDWLVGQIAAGKDTEEIRKALTLTESEKAEYLRKAIVDPSSITPDMPPPLAFQMKIKYPDIYNRYRKLRGPIRATKEPKPKRLSKKRKRALEEAENTGNSATPDILDPNTNSAVDPILASGEYMTHQVDDNAINLHNHESRDLSHTYAGPQIKADHDDGVLRNLGNGAENDNSVDHQFDVDLSSHEMLAQFADQQGHADLAQALLRLPGGPDSSSTDHQNHQSGSSHQNGGIGVNIGDGPRNGVHGDEDDHDGVDGANFAEQVFKMARMAAAEADHGGGADEEADANTWEAIQLMQ